MLFKGFLLCAIAALAAPSFAAGRPITAADLLAMSRVSDPQISPDGSRVLYSVAVPDMSANRMARDVWVVTVATSEARNLTKNGHEGGARWSPDGRTVAFVSTRDKGAQLYLMSTDGGDAKALTSLS